MKTFVLALPLVLFLSTTLMVNSTKSFDIDASRLINLEQTPIVEHERWAVLVCGSNDYWLGFQNDIEDMYLMLKNELKYDDGHVYYVAPSQWNYQGTHYYNLSKMNVFNAIDAVASRSDSDDTLFFLYTAHGANSWLDANGDNYVDTTEPSNDIHVGDLDLELDKIDPPYYLTPRKCRRMVILIQSSYSGSFLYRLGYNEAYPQWMPHLHRIIITSTDANTNSWEDMGVYGDPSWDPNGPNDDGNVANGDDDGSEFSGGFRQAFRDVDADGYAQADEVTYPGGAFYPSGFIGGNQNNKVSILESFKYADYMDCWTKRYDNPTSQAEVPGWKAEYPQIWSALYDGYSNGIDPSTTYIYIPTVAIYSFVTWKWLDPYEKPVWLTANVTVFGSYPVEDFNFNRSLGQISFNLTSDTPGFCNLTIPKLLMDGAFRVLINDTDTASILSWNRTHAFIYFTHDQGTHNVAIIGEIITRIRSLDLLSVADVDCDKDVDIADIFMVARRIAWKEDG